MNMLFWVWYSKYKKQLEDDEDDACTFTTDVDAIIPSPIYVLIGILCGLAIIGVSWLFVKILC